MKKSALIVSASSDVASATALKLANKGFSLILTSKKIEGCKSLMEDIYRNTNKECIFIPLDITDIHSFDDFFSKLKLIPDLILLCPGQMESENLLKSNEKGAFTEEINEIINVNYCGPLIFITKLTDFLIKEKKKISLIVLSSVSGDRGRAKNPFYGSSKAGLTSFCSSLRQYLNNTNISIITVKPGFIKTKMTNHLKLPPLITSSPDQIANLIYKSYKNQTSVVYSKYWFLIMMLVKVIPEPIFKRMNF